MRLASYNVRGRTSYGVVVGNGVVDLRVRFGARHPTLVDLLRDNALHEAGAAVLGVRPDFALAEVELLPPLVAPEKILCIGINYANRNADFDDPNIPKYPSRCGRASPSSSTTRARSRS
jgi:2-keto-4-pentenoate hydratase/2-oxohepta-3-ene-1,7-dioic acid hydratase in catechol pathway